MCIIMHEHTVAKCKTAEIRESLTCGLIKRGNLVVKGPELLLQLGLLVGQRLECFGTLLLFQHLRFFLFLLRECVLVWKKRRENTKHTHMYTRAHTNTPQALQCGRRSCRPHHYLLRARVSSWPAAAAAPLFCWKQKIKKARSSKCLIAKITHTHTHTHTHTCLRECKHSKRTAPWPLSFGQLGKRGSSRS